jgi:hypothetical protein
MKKGKEFERKRNKTKLMGGENKKKTGARK